MSNELKDLVEFARELELGFRIGYTLANDSLLNKNDYKTAKDLYEVLRRHKDDKLEDKIAFYNTILSNISKSFWKGFYKGMDQKEGVDTSGL